MSGLIPQMAQPVRGLALQTMADAKAFGDLVAASEFAPKDFRGKGGSCVLAIQFGAEIGLSPMQALQSIAVVNGRPSIYGDAALAVVKASPLCEYVTETVEGEGDRMVAICTAQRRGDPSPTVRQFSVADAKQAQLWGKAGPWTQYARRMLQMRARGFALRDAFPDVLRGLVTAEEAGDSVINTPPVVVASRPTPEVRPKFDEEHAAPPAAVPDGTAADMARKAIAAAMTLAQLEKLKPRIDQRLKEKAIAAFEADELLDLIQDKAEQLGGAVRL